MMRFTHSATLFTYSNGMHQHEDNYHVSVLILQCMLKWYLSNGKIFGSNNCHQNVPLNKCAIHFYHRIIIHGPITLIIIFITQSISMRNKHFGEWVIVNSDAQSCPWCIHWAHMYMSPHPYHSCNVISQKLDFGIFSHFWGFPAGAEWHLYSWKISANS